MITILSPAKNMREGVGEGLSPTRPRFLPRAAELCSALRAYAPWELESLFSVNQEIALRAHDSFSRFSTERRGTPALLAYHGLQYKNLCAGDFTPEDFCFAQEHLCILSAFYGLLRPMDGIQPYRLEMQCRFRPCGGSLYDYWGEAVCRALFERGELVLNLASAEYAAMITPYLAPGNRLVTCRFYSYRRGGYRMVATHAKMARGQMARYIVRNRIDSLEEVLRFSWEGFTYSPERSTLEEIVFLQI